MSEKDYFSARHPVSPTITDAVPERRGVLRDCPLCGAELESGELAVQAVLPSWLGGPSWQECWFQPGNGQEAEQIVPLLSSRAALRCRRCHSVVIPGESFQPRPAGAERVEADTTVSELFGKAGKLAQQGDWAEAAALYERLAAQLEGEQDGEYARRCAQELRGRLAQMEKR